MEKQGGQEGRKRAGFRAPDNSNSDRIAKGKSARQKQQRSRGGGEKRQTKATATERRRGKAPDKTNSDREAEGKGARQRQQRSRGGREKRQTKATAIERRRGNRGKPMERRPGNADDLLPLLPFSSSSSCFSSSSSFSSASSYSFSSCMGSRASSISP